MVQRDSATTLKLKMWHNSLEFNFHHHADFLVSSTFVMFVNESVSKCSVITCKTTLLVTLQFIEPRNLQISSRDCPLMRLPMRDLSKSEHFLLQIIIVIIININNNIIIIINIYRTMTEQWNYHIKWLWMWWCCTEWVNQWTLKEMQWMVNNNNNIQ